MINYSKYYQSGELDEVIVGNLIIPTGEIVACDPLVNLERNPFTRKVRHGNFPVKLLFDNYDNCIAFAVIEFSQNPVNKWEMAVLPGQDISSLKPEAYFGYPVDAGLGCFMDKATAEEWITIEKELLKQKNFSNYYDDILDAELEQNHQNWANHYPNKDKELNCILFRSGWGDGVYGTFWGLDENNEPVCLLTDFNLIDEDSD